MQALFRNKEIKYMAFKFIIFQVIILLLSTFLINMQLKKLNNIYLVQNSAVLGKILKLNPEEESNIIKYYTKDISEADLEYGKAILSKYGYDEALALSEVPQFKGFYKGFMFQTYLYLIILLLTIFTFIIFDYKKLFNNIKKISSEAEKIISGNFNIKLSENGEGDFYILCHQFNEMGKRLKLSMDTLKKEKRFLKDITSDISHQLKTPLSSLIMFNEILLKDSKINEETRQDFIEKSAEQLSRMEWLIKSLLKLARLESKSIEFNCKNSSLLKTLEKAVSPIKIQLENKNQKILLTSKEDILFPHDSNWTAEAITNIIKNSVEHSKDGSNIEIIWEETPLCVQIFIRDQGKGINEQELPRIFDRFYKGTSNVNPNSIGIGLALSKSIVEGQGGSIIARSKVNLGSEFQITFLKAVI